MANYKYAITRPNMCHCMHVYTGGTCSFLVASGSWPFEFVAFAVDENVRRSIRNV